MISILVAGTLIALGMCIFLLLDRNRSSTRDSPTPSTTPTPTSPDVVTLMTMMKEMTETRDKEISRLVTSLVFGVQPQPTTGLQETSPTPNDLLTNYDDDSIPLSPGIEQILDREANETVLGALQKERRELQEHIAELQQARLDQLASEDSSQVPLTPSERSPTPTPMEPSSPPFHET